MLNIRLLKWPSRLNTVKYLSEQCQHKYTEAMGSQFTRSTNLWSSWIDLSIITVLFKAQPNISPSDSFKGYGRFWLMSWQDTAYTSCYVSAPSWAMGQARNHDTRCLIPHYSQVYMQTKLWDCTQYGRLWHVRGQYGHQRTGALS